MPRPRIPTVKPLLTPMAGRFGTQDKGQGGKTEAERSRHRDDTQPWRRWYKTARWQRLREAIFARDGYVCRRNGELLSGKHPAPNSPVANHITPHRGDPDLFWDPENIETVSKRVHDGEIQSEERRGAIW